MESYPNCYTCIFDAGWGSFSSDLNDFSVVLAAGAARNCATLVVANQLDHWGDNASSQVDQELKTLLLLEGCAP